MLTCYSRTSWLKDFSNSVFKDEYTCPCGVPKYSSNIQLEGKGILNI